MHCFVRILSIVWTASLVGMAGAAEIDVAVAAPDTLDEEVVTNIAYNVTRDDIRRFAVRLEFDSSCSNAVEVAIGCDSNRDGNLDAEETGLVLGCHAGRYFIENCAEEQLYAEHSETPVASTRYLQMRLDIDAQFHLRHVCFDSDDGLRFNELATTMPSWLLSRRWNLVKVTRRGERIAAETCNVVCKYNDFSIIIR